MISKQFILGGCLAAALTLFTVPAGAREVCKCVPGKPTAASYTWDFQKEANHLFRDLEQEARQARNHADDLESIAGNYQIGWQIDADHLMPLRHDINEMGRQLCRLETIRRVLPAWQQKSVDRIATTLRLMADNAQDAIVFGNSQQEHLWSPTYQKYVHNLYDESVRLRHSTNAALEYARLERPGAEVKAS